MKTEEVLSAGKTLMLGPEEQNVIPNTHSLRKRLLKLNILTRTVVAFTMAIKVKH